MHKKIVPDSPKKGNAKVLTMPNREKSRAEKRLAAFEALAKSLRVASDALTTIVAELREELAEAKKVVH
jgi:hypothetical protein